MKHALLWYLTFEAHRETSLFHLCRLYDQHHDSWNLKKWLTTLRHNLQLLAGSQSQAPPTLATDILSVCRCDSDVSQVVWLRNKELAHRDPQRVLSAHTDTTSHLTVGTVDKLVGRAQEIVNRYTQLLSRETYSTKMVGHDDYLCVLRAVRKAISDARREAE
jgi:hypothetical protein